MLVQYHLIHCQTDLYKSFNRRGKSWVLQTTAAEEGVHEGSSGFYGSLAEGHLRKRVGGVRGWVDRVGG